MSTDNGRTPGASAPTMHTMLLDPQSCYRALQARDARFDGRFFVGVSLEHGSTAARLHGEGTEARELPVLPERCGGGIVGLSALSALPP